MASINKKYILYGIHTAFLLYSFFTPPEAPSCISQIIEVVKEQQISANIQPPTAEIQSLLSETITSPTQNTHSLLKTFIDTITSNYDYSNYDVLVV